MNRNRVLFISHDPFSEIGNNGKTYLSLFSNFEDKEVSQLYFNKLQPSSKKFYNFFRITDYDILKYLLSFRKNIVNGKVKKEEIHQLEARSIKRSLFRVEIVKLIRNFLYLIVKIKNIESFSLWIENFKPTVIFCSGTNYLFIYKVLEQISVKYNIPYYIYFTDDYFKYNNGTNYITKFIHKRFVKRAKRIVEGAEELFVISPKMQQEYTSYFDKKCTILINAVERETQPEIKTHLSEFITFRYFGWLHSDRSSSLRYLGECIKFINQHYNQKCILEVFTLSIPHGKTASDLAIDTIKIYDPIIGEELKEKITSSDFLVHAESFEPKDMQITMLSISTKIPEYLLSERCIIAIGPSKLASIDVLEENKLGVVLSKKKSMEDDANLIYQVINDIHSYNEYCRKSAEYCTKEFNALSMRKALKSKLFKH